MDQQSEHAFSTGEIFEPEPIEEHVRGCLCTGCTLERQLERAGRYDREQHVARHLRRAMELRQELQQVPTSAGDGENASGAAALADSAVRESVPNRKRGAA